MTKKMLPSTPQRRYLEDVRDGRMFCAVRFTSSSTRDACRRAGWVIDGKLSALGLHALEAARAAKAGV